MTGTGPRLGWLGTQVQSRTRAGTYKRSGRGANHGYRGGLGPLPAHLPQHREDLECFDEVTVDDLLSGVTESLESITSPRPPPTAIAMPNLPPQTLQTRTSPRPLPKETTGLHPHAIDSITMQQEPAYEGGRRTGGHSRDGAHRPPPSTPPPLQNQHRPETTSCGLLLNVQACGTPSTQAAIPLYT